MIKWRLMLTTLPITALILLIKFGVVHGLQYEGLVKFSEIGLVITGGIFLIGFMLAGTISDYKESEKIPAEIACSLETIEDTFVLGSIAKGGFDLSSLRKQLNGVTDSIISWFEQRESAEEVFAGISSITTMASVLEIAEVGAIASRISGEQHNLRKLFSRVSVIRRTYFLATGYALLDVLTVVIICLLIVSKFENEFTGVIIISFITQIFVYMLRLIRDIDEPFEYSPSGNARAADVDLFPLMDYDRRAKSRI
jgi:hypothetical protein